MCKPLGSIVPVTPIYFSAAIVRGTVMEVQKVEWTRLSLFPFHKAKERPSAHHACMQY